MRILLLGHSSLLARHIAAQLAGRHELVLAGRGKGADIVCDLATDRIPDNVPSCDALIHCAAAFEPDTLEGALANERVNGLGAFVAAKLCAAAACSHLIYCSSMFCESHPENQYRGAYAVSKAHGEDNLAFCCERLGIRFTSLRMSQLYDAQGEARGHQPLFYHIVDQARSGRDISFYGTKDRSRNFLFIEDVPPLMERVLQCETSGVHAMVAPVSHTLSELAAAAYAAFGTSGTIGFLSDKPDVKSVFIPPHADLYRRIGAAPAIDLAQGLGRIRRAIEEGRHKVKP